MELARAYPDDGRSGRAVFSNANSIVRRADWLEQPFDEALAIAEDLSGRVGRYGGQAHRLRAGRGGCAFPRLRFGSSGAAEAEDGPRPVRGVSAGLAHDTRGMAPPAAADFRTLVAWGGLSEWPRACLFRLAQLLGNYHGARQAS